MRLAVVADVHTANHRRFGGPMQCGLNRRCREILSVLAEAVARAKAAGCDRLAVLGDLYDTTRPEPQVVAAAQAAFGKTNPVLMMGNHDQVSAEPGDHALGPMNPVAQLITEPAVISNVAGSNIILIPFRPGNAVEWLPKVLDALLLVHTSRTSADVLLLHLGIVDSSTAPWLRSSHDAVPLELVEDLCAKHGIVAVLAGNWHNRKAWNVGVPSRSKKPLVCQVGALAPTGWDNPGLDGYGSLIIWDSKNPFTLEVHEIPGPRFVKMKEAECADLGETHRNLVYLSVVATSDRVSAAHAELDRLRGAGRIVDGEVVLDDEEVRVAARSAARVARSADTLEEALAGFVNQMALPEGVLREDVLAAARSYLNA